MEEPRQVFEAGVVVAIRPRDEETDVVPGAASDLGGLVREGGLWPLEDELRALHAGTSHTDACA
jgi:hypothetical protein